jgi:AcrR family transcriptional regulator
MTKRQEAAQETRKAIIRAAAKLIEAKGLDAISIDDIAAEAGVSKGSFYTYFAHKEDVLDEIGYTEFDKIIETARSIEDPYVKISSFLIDSIEYIESRGNNMCRDWTRCSATPGDVRGKKKMEYDRKTIAELLSLDERDPEVTWILNGYYGIVFRWAMTGGEIDPVAEMRSFCEGPVKRML